MPVQVDAGKCPQNHRCPLVAICPAEAISQQGNSLPVIDADRCVECGLCVEQCPKGAMHMAE